MRYSSKAIPENVLRCMKPEDRRPLGKAGLTLPEIGEKQAAKREKELQENCASLLRQRNISFIRQRMDRRTTGPVGQPDFVFVIKGKPYAVECKVGDGVLTAAQSEMLWKMQNDGWTIRLVCTEHEFMAILNEAKA